MPVDKSLKPNGFAIKSWGDVIAVVSMAGLIIGVLTWGLKLEGEINALRDTQANLLRQVGNGILPRAEERIKYLEREVEKLERIHEASSARN